MAGARRDALVSRLAVEALEDRSVPSAVAAGYAPGDVIVRLRDGVSGAALGAAADPLGGQLYRVNLPAGVAVPQAVAAYAARADVLFAEPDAVIRAAALPNDPRFGEQWGLNNTGQTGGANDADTDAPAGWN